MLANGVAPWPRRTVSGQDLQLRLSVGIHTGEALPPRGQGRDSKVPRPRFLGKGFPSSVVNRANSNKLLKGASFHPVSWTQRWPSREQRSLTQRITLLLCQTWPSRFAVTGSRFAPSPSTPPGKVPCHKGPLEVGHIPQRSCEGVTSKAQVLCGCIGSNMKMKFGCIGDAMNLASRLQGLCKFYDVDVMLGSQSQKVPRKRYKTWSVASPCE